MRLAGFTLALFVAAAAPAAAQPYNFDVRYFGNGVSSLAPGSDNPVGTNILAGDSFVWRITAQNGGFWNVLNGGSFFPFMAFGVDESAERTGDFTLNLFRNGVNTFTRTESGAVQSFVHMGTNSITLSAGLEFDVMELSYTLLSALDNGNPVNSTINSTLPIFGTPDELTDDIAYQQGTVPEPASLALVGIGLSSMLVAVRRRKA